MKFSYLIFKKLLPSLRNPQHLANLLTMHLFEVEAIEGNSLDIKILANRYSDAACYWGMAQVISAALKKKFKIPESKKQQIKARRDFTVEVKAKNCRRMTSRYFADVEIGPSPEWLVAALVSSGQRSINNLVDITNYVTHETGQPLHAFNFENMTDCKLIVRNAREGEQIQLLDNQAFTLVPSDMVLADTRDALDIAGVKGGKKAEITNATKTVLLTAGNFDGASIYRTAKRLGIRTDASLRFSHDISPELVLRGLDRATELIVELCKGKLGGTIDVYPKQQSFHAVKFDIDRFNAMTGLTLELREGLDYLERLGCTVRKQTMRTALVEAPAVRTDIAIPEDLIEEALSLRGYDAVPVTAPHVALHEGHENPETHFAERLKHILVSCGFSEVYNYSFASRGEVELENPISEDKRFLRESLIPGLVKNVEDNLRFFDEVRIFEMGAVFKKGRGAESVKESQKLGLAIGAKKHLRLLELKGVIEALAERLRIKDVFVHSLHGGVYQIEAGHRELGLIKILQKGQMRVAVAECDLHALFIVSTSDPAFQSIPKFPAVQRDISIKVSKSVRTGDMREAMEQASTLMKDGAEAIDFYTGARVGEGRQGITFRLKFRAEDRTLRDAEVDVEVRKVVEMLREKFEAEIR